MNNRQMLKTSQLKPNISKNVMRDLRGLNRFSSSQGIEFEQYIEELFINLNWQVLTTPNSGDYGVDLVVQSPSGGILIVQAKDESKSLGVQAIQEVVTGASFYEKEPRLQGKQITHKIVIASGQGFSDDINNLYTANAKELASRTNSILWTPKELQILADAAVHGQHLLEPIGLYQVPTSQKTKRFNWLWMLGFVPLIFVYWVIPKETRTAIKNWINPTAYRQVEAQRITNFVSFWNQTYQQALKNNNLEVILPYMVGEQKTGVTALFEARKQRGCILTIQERSPYQIAPITFITLDTAKTAIFRDAAYIENCSDGSQRLLRDGTQVKVTYDLEKINGNWRITESITSGGAIK